MIRLAPSFSGNWPARRYVSFRKANLVLTFCLSFIIRCPLSLCNAVQPNSVKLRQFSVKFRGCMIARFLKLRCSAFLGQAV